MNLKREDFKNHPIASVGKSQLERIVGMRLSDEFWEVYSELMNLAYQCGWDDYNEQLWMEAINNGRYSWAEKIHEIWNKIEEKRT